jgi:ribosomal protein S8
LAAACCGARALLPAVAAAAAWCGRGSTAAARAPRRHPVAPPRAGKIVVELNGRLNKCGVISPRYDISHHEVEAWVARLLPSRLFGHIVLTTSAGIMDHDEARRKGVGGKVLGFFY